MKHADASKAWRAARAAVQLARVEGNSLLWAGVGFAATLFGLRRRGILAAAVGGLAARKIIRSLVAQAVPGKDRPADNPGPPRRADAWQRNMKRAVTINRSPEEVYRFVRDAQDLTQILQSSGSGNLFGRTPFRCAFTEQKSTTFPTHIQIIDDQPAERITWRSLERGAVPNGGSIGFKDAPGGRGAEITITFEYARRPGVVDKVVSTLRDRCDAGRLQDAAATLKQLIEAGEVATTEGQTSARAESA